MKLPMQKHTHQQVPGRLEFLFFLWMLQRLSLCMYTSFYAVSRECMLHRRIYLYHVVGKLRITLAKK
ncbi:unnamed protein product [Sphagnum troendelagicum]|uniref:Uncharacterized protein n=1 Tax=Sphagnum troendelagicum TaxID=128251 RepID=A0ABP0TZY4_9BRYO